MANKYIMLPHLILTKHSEYKFKGSFAKSEWINSDLIVSTLDKGDISINNISMRERHWRVKWKEADELHSHDECDQCQRIERLWKFYAKVINHANSNLSISSFWEKGAVPKSKRQNNQEMIIIELYNAKYLVAEELKLCRGKKSGIDVCRQFLLKYEIAGKKDYAPSKLYDLARRIDPDKPEMMVR